MTEARTTGGMFNSMMRRGGISRFSIERNKVQMNLPPELYQAIFQNVHNRADLYRLLLVSHTISDEAERVLYHTIRIPFDERPTLISLKLISHLTHCQRVARHVRNLKISGRPSTYAVAGVENPRQYWHALNQSLCALTNLRILKLAVLVQHSRGLVYPPSNIFANCTFKLNVLILLSYRATTLPHLDLTYIKELSLPGRSSRGNVIEFPPGAFPALQILTSTLPQFLELGISNTRQIRALDLRGERPSTFPTIIGNITSLKTHSDLCSMVQCFPLLRYLELLLADLPHPRILFPRILERLTILKNLEKLCIIQHRVCEYLWHAAQVFSALNSLQEFIVIPPQSRHGRHWRRGSSGGASVVIGDLRDEWKNPDWF